MHGFTYNHNYWDFPGFNGRYSYVKHANAAGYATLNVDRIGTGHSSRPLGASFGGISDAWVAHQLIQKLRRGAIPSALGTKAFNTVVEVGHSYGSAVVWIEAAKYKDVDGVIISGLNHYLRYDTLTNKLAASLVPTPVDKHLSKLGIDPTYVTTRPGTRYEDYFAPAPVHKQVLRQDEKLKGDSSVTEGAEIPTLYQIKRHIGVPVLLAQGNRDQLFCGAGVDCSSAAQLVRKEKPSLGPKVPCVDGYLLPDAGHSINLMPNAESWFKKSNKWMAAHLSAKQHGGLHC